VELEQLVEVVQQMRQEGEAERYIAYLEVNGFDVDPEEVADSVRVPVKPEEVVTPPAIGTADAASIDLGKQIYQRLTCDSCHGSSGTGDPSTPLFDDGGYPTFARDLVHDPLKGGKTPQSLYLRIRVGMPGTPHPAADGLSEQELVALVHYCQSLAQEPKTMLTNFERATRETSHPAWDLELTGE
jgi:mono/diheme cytochrome c family protein